MQLDEAWLRQQGEDAALLRCVDTAFPDPIPERIGIAVSGGGDSVALLHLFARWSAQTGHTIAAVTVDHGLRDESADEARGVARLCETLGISHDILHWRRPAGAGNLPAAARDGRYALMADWAKTTGVGGAVLGHTLDDSAETFLMRLGRAAGLDGLAEMHSRFGRGGLRWSRPFSQVKRGDLRAYLRRHEIAWIEDPSNDDPRYLRTRARHALRGLADLGITADGIHQSSHALRQAQSALAHYTRLEAHVHVTQDGGDLLFPVRIDPPIPAEVERRLAVAALRWVGSAAYPPRKAFSGDLEAEVGQQQRLTLGGCLILKRKGQFRITREYNAVKDTVSNTDALWDTRWRLEGPHAGDLEVRALGDGVKQLEDWRKTGLPRPTLMASPAVWRGDTLVAVPLAGYNPEWSAQIVADFASFLLSH